MKELGQAPAIEVPKQVFGFLSMPELASQKFPQAFKRALSQYAPESLGKVLDGEFLFDKTGLTKGSNSFIPVLMNQKNLFPEGEHLLSIAEFGRAFNKDGKVFKETYQDQGICARTSNNHFSERLIKQIQERGITPTPENPVVISLTDLKLKQDKKSTFGFIYELKDDADLIIAPEYGTNQPITKFSIYGKRGIAIPDKSGKYTIYKTNAGVSRVYSYYDQVAGSDDERLANSYTYGRVVVGKNAVPQNLAEIEEIISKVEQIKIATKKDLEAIIAKL